MTQVAWLAGLEALELYDESYGVPLELYVRQRVWNALKSHWRREDRQSSHSFSLEGLEWDGAQGLATDPTSLSRGSGFSDSSPLIIRQAVARLPEKERFVVEKLFWEEQTLEDIARELKVSAVWVYKLKERALKRLRLHLEGESVSR